MKVITWFLPEWLVWVDTKWPFISIRKGRRVK